MVAYVVEVLPPADSTIGTPEPNAAVELDEILGPGDQRLHEDEIPIRDPDLAAVWAPVEVCVFHARRVPYAFPQVKAQFWHVKVGK